MVVRIKQEEICKSPSTWPNTQEMLNAKYTCADSDFPPAPISPSVTPFLPIAPPTPPPASQTWAASLSSTHPSLYLSHSAALAHILMLQ